MIPFFLTVNFLKKGEENNLFFEHVNILGKFFSTNKLPLKRIK